MRLRSVVLWILIAPMLSGCGLHLYRQEHAQLAQSAKKTFTEKVDLLSLVTTERANLAKQRDAELAAVRQSQVYERDLVFFNAARLEGDERFLVLRLPVNEDACNEPLKLRYVARRACELGAKTTEKLTTLSNAAGEVYRSRIRREFVEDNRASLQELGWTEAPKCSAIPARDDRKDETKPEEVAKKMEGALALNIPAKDQASARRVLLRVIKYCHDLAESEVNLAKSEGLEHDAAQLKSLQQQQAEVADEGKRVSAKLKEIAEKLKTLAEGEAKAGDTRKAIAAEAKKLREWVGNTDDVLKKLGAQEALADLQVDAATTLLQALEGQPIADDKLKGDAGNDLRRAVIVAQTVPQLADEMNVIEGLLNAPSKSSLLIAQRQAMLDKDRVAARKAHLEKRVELVRRRISQVVEEARLLQLASSYSGKADCEAAVARHKDSLPPDEFKVALKECGRDPASRLLLGMNYLSRSILVARADQEATRWEDVYLGYEQSIAANEYALKSWNNLVGTPIVLLEGYHTGGIKAEALGDLIFKMGSLGLLGIIVKKAD